MIKYVDKDSKASYIEKDSIMVYDNRIDEIEENITGVTTELAKTQSQFNQAVGEITVDSEVVLARNEHTTLKERLDSDVEEFTQHKLDYTQQRSQDQLKVATIDKELKEYQSTMASVNVNQEAKQSVTGYGVVSLPKNCANGQVSASVKGFTATNLVKNGDFSEGSVNWKPLSSFNISSINNTLICTSNSSTPSTGVIGQDLTLKAGGTQKMYVTANITSKSVGISSFDLVMRGSKGGTSGTVVVKSNPSPVVGVNSILSKVVTLSNETVGYVRLCVRPTFLNLGDVIEIKDVFAIDLTTTFGSGNEPTTEECDKMFANYFDSTKSTISASRLKSVGKNLFDGKNVIKGQTIDPANGATFNYLVSWRSNYITVQPSMPYTVGKFNEIVSNFISFYDSNYNWISRTSGTNIITRNFTTPINTKYLVITEYGFSSESVMLENLDKSKIQLQLEQNTVATPYETYSESTSYLPNVGELRSLPNGTKDEIRVSGGKAEHIQRVSDKTILDGLKVWGDGTDLGTVYRFSLANNLIGANLKGGVSNLIINEMQWLYRVDFTGDNEHFYLGSSSLIFMINKATVDLQTGTTSIQKFKNYLNQYPITLTYQLAEPIITPIDVSGTLLSNPNGTVYVEPVVADAGIYTTKFDIMDLQLPIKSVDKLIKYNFATGVQTVLDASLAVINANKLSFTHPNLTDKDIVFVDYFYDVESTLGETTIEYYDSRHTIKDTTNSKFYSWKINSTNGVPIVALTEVL